MSDFDVHHNIGAQLGDGDTMYLNVPPDKRTGPSCPRLGV